MQACGQDEDKELRDIRMRNGFIGAVFRSAVVGIAIGILL